MELDGVNVLGLILLSSGVTGGVRLGVRSVSEHLGYTSECSSIRFLL